ncbi:MAG: uroporphyrinogen-III synthase [Betaproteobacteria bacterium]
MNALAGAGILVTRPVAQAARLSQLVREAGGKPIAFPALEIEALAVAPVDAGAGFDMLIFVSPNAARLGLPLVRPAIDSQTKIAAIGSGTVAELKKNGVQDIISPRSGHDSEALLAELADFAPRRALIIRGEGGREVLGEVLRSRDTAVEYLECYRRLKPARDMRDLLSDPIHGEVKACTATSANIVVNLFEMAGVENASWLRGLPFFVSHARVAATAFSRGVQTVFVAGNGDEALVAGLTSWFARLRERASP